MEYIGIITFIAFLVLIIIYFKFGRKKQVLIASIICFLITGALVAQDPNFVEPKKESKPNESTSETNNDSKDNNQVESGTVENEKEKEEKSKYLTHIEWADTSNYMFAIEIDDFDGDIAKAGKYNFITTGKTDGKHVAIVWDVYISTNRYQNMSELSDSEYVTSIGGTNNDSCSITLEKGQYVYINYNKPVSKPSGMIKIELVE